MSEYKGVIDKVKKENEEKKQQKKLRKKYKVEDENVLLKEKNVLPILILEKLGFALLILLSATAIFMLLDIEMRELFFSKISEALANLKGGN